MNDVTSSRNEPDDSSPLPVRKRPAHGVLLSESEAAIVFLTVCTKDRKPWLASSAVHDVLRDTWSQANAWLVGRYVLMPDHIHLFAAASKAPSKFENWVRYWKSLCTKELRASKLGGLPAQLWQTDHWDTRLRNWRAYDEKWEYVRSNPVRHRFFAHPDLWPYQGEIHRLTWD